MSIYSNLCLDCGEIKTRCRCKTEVDQADPGRRGLHPRHDEYIQHRLGADACTCSRCGKTNTAIVHTMCGDCLRKSWAEHAA